jgi:hypothetical protein
LEEKKKEEATTTTYYADEILFDFSKPADRIVLVNDGTAEVLRTIELEE